MSKDKVIEITDLIIQRRLTRTQAAEVWIIDGLLGNNEIKHGIGQLSMISSKNDYWYITGCINWQCEILDGEEGVMRIVDLFCNNLSVSSFILSITWRDGSVDCGT